MTKATHGSVNYGAVGAVGSSAGMFAIPGANLLNNMPTFDINTITLPSIERFKMKSSITFSLVKANGGMIVICQKEPSIEPDYYVIPEGVRNFDKELGKIISMQMLKG